MVRTRAALLLFGCAALAAPAWAHHSAAQFDASKRMTVEGTVKEWQWTNPHAWLQLLVPGAKGQMTEMGFELGSPNTLTRNGFRRDSFKPGDKVTVVGSPRKDGMSGGALVQVRTSDGRWLQWGPGADAKAAAEAGVPTQ
jgi:hypothetical protein